MCILVVAIQIARSKLDDHVSVFFKLIILLHENTDSRVISFVPLMCDFLLDFLLLILLLLTKIPFHVIRKISAVIVGRKLIISDCILISRSLL